MHQSLNGALRCHPLFADLGRRRGGMGSAQLQFSGRRLPYGSSPKGGAAISKWTPICKAYPISASLQNKNFSLVPIFRLQQAKRKHRTVGTDSHDSHELHLLIATKRNWLIHSTNSTALLLYTCKSTMTVR